MRRGLQATLVLALGISVLGLASSFGWGETADRLVTNKAVDTLPPEMQPFFQANRQFLVQHVTDSDESAVAHRRQTAARISSSSITTARSRSPLCPATTPPPSQI